MEKKYAVLLVRVSTEKQFYESQILDLQTYAKKEGYTDFITFSSKETGFADYEKKIGTNEVFQYIKDNPKYDSIFVTELSRVGRRSSVLHAVKDYLERNKIQFYIKDVNYKLLDENKKLTNEGSMMFGMYAMFSEAEMKQKNERFKRKKKELLENGHSAGGKVLFGYDRVPLENTKKNTYKINKVQEKEIQTIFNWYLNGIPNGKRTPSILDISKECEKRKEFHSYTYSKRNVNKLLKEKGYTGWKTTNNKWKNPKYGINETEDDKPYLTSSNNILYEQIIDQVTFDRVQNKMLSNRINVDKSISYVTILSKLIICPSCGRFLGPNYRIKDGKNHNSYRCSSRAYTKSCDFKNSSISMQLLDSSIWSLIKSDLPRLSKKINLINPNYEIANIEKYIDNLKIKIHTNELEEINIRKRLKNAKKFKDVDIMEYEDDRLKEISKITKENKNIKTEINKLELEKSLINDKTLDIKYVVDSNLLTIETDKDLLKKYVNSFVENINIIEHNTKITVLEIEMRDLSISTNYDIMTKKMGLNLPIKMELIYLIIDKKVTRNIQLYAFRLSQSDTKKTFAYMMKTTVLPMIYKEIENKTYALTTPKENEEIIKGFNEDSTLEEGSGPFNPKDWDYNPLSYKVEYTKLNV
jgi:DNA invertase Pin-like site-specific DNA recombinase